jgi:hypothetical protein
MPQRWLRRIGMMAVAGFIAGVLAIGLFGYVLTAAVGPVLIAAAVALAIQLMTE